MILTQAFGGVMRKRLFAVVYALLLQFLSTAALAANVVPPSDPLWRFDTQGCVFISPAVVG